MKLKVLFITRKWPPAIGGMETYSVELAEELARRIDLTKKVLPGRRNGLPPGVFMLLWFGMKTAVWLMRHAARFDVAHAGDMAIWPLAWTAWLRNPNLRVILSAHGTDVAYAERSGFKAWLYRRYLRAGARLLSKATVIANSRATGELLDAHGFTDITVIPLAAKQADHATAHSYASTAPSPEPYALFVGRLIEQKGCAWFIREVLPLLPETMRFKVAGTVIDKSEGDALDHPRVDYLGPIFGDDLANLRRQASAVVIPNIIGAHNRGFEGFGLAATEAASAGSVVLASNAYGLKDAVIDNETGFLLPPGDAHSWARKITAVAEWPAEKRSAFLARAAATARAFYCWSRVAKETLNAYGAPAKGAAAATTKKWETA